MNEQKAIIFDKKQSFLIKLNKIISRVYFENARNNCKVLPVPRGHIMQPV